MLTIFAVPKPFIDRHINIIQRNAIKSWTLLHPECEVILFGREDGLAETAKEFNVKHIPDIVHNKWGTPLWSSAFKLARKESKNDILVYVESDNILMPDFIKAVQSIKRPLFLMTGQRWDVDIKEPIRFDDPDWENKLREFVINHGELHGPAAMDYFLFPSRFQFSLPPFPVGRPLHDNWFIYKVRSLKVPVIDATEVVMGIHQNHDYSHYPKGKKGVWEGEEAKENLKLAGGFSHAFNLKDADYLLTSQGLKKKKISLAYLIRYFETLPALHPGIGSWPKIISLMLQPKRVAKAILRRIKIL